MSLSARMEDFTSSVLLSGNLWRYTLQKSIKPFRWTAGNDLKAIRVSEIQLLTHLNGWEFSDDLVAVLWMWTLPMQKSITMLRQHVSLKDLAQGARSSGSSQSQVRLMPPAGTLRWPGGRAGSFPWFCGWGNVSQCKCPGWTGFRPRMARSLAFICNPTDTKCDKHLLHAWEVTAFNGPECKSWSQSAYVQIPSLLLELFDIGWPCDLPLLSFVHL
jgi:hypothetical protein